MNSIRRLMIILGLALLILHTQSATNWTEVDNKINEKIFQGHFTGCVLGVYSANATLLKKAYGTMTPKWGLYAPPVTVDNVFDINYLTQVIGINSGFMQLYDNMKLNVTDKVTRYLIDFDNNSKRNITITNLMLHNSGLQATYTDNFGTTPA